MITWGRVLLGSVLLLVGCTAGGQPATTAGEPASPSMRAATGCAGRVETGSLPDWADEGFHGDARMPHVFGARGEIVAVLFGHPLAQVRPDASSNKILWVARPATTSPAPDASTTLKITARLDGTDTRVTHEVAGGPGPSIIDMPRAGCWHLDLRWAGRTDTMDLVYADRKP
ncbi:hypothetical protein ACTFTM_17235 [Micromonospora sp. RB23]